MDYAKADYGKINTELNSIDWDSLLNGNINEDWCRYRDILQDMESRYVPRRIRKENKRQKPIWVTKKAAKKVKKSRRILRNIGTGSTLRW